MRAVIIRGRRADGTVEPFTLFRCSFCSEFFSTEAECREHEIGECERRSAPAWLRNFLRKVDDVADFWPSVDDGYAIDFWHDKNGPNWVVRVTTHGRFVTVSDFSKLLHGVRYPGTPDTFSEFPSVHFEIDDDIPHVDVIGTVRKGRGRIDVWLRFEISRAWDVRDHARAKVKREKKARARIGREARELVAAVTPN